MDTASVISGYSVFTDDCLIDSGVINLTSVKDTELRMKEMCKSLFVLLNKYTPDVVTVETTAVVTNAKTQRILTMIVGAVYGYCIENNIEFQMFRPSEWRALISKGEKGKKRKELKEWSKNKVVELFNLSVGDDESDAILIGQAYINKINNERQRR